MIIKQRDSLRSRKLELEILKKHELPPEKSYLVDQEWRKLIQGEKGEKDTAYLLDFYLDESPNWMLIHDLRIEHNGKSAQIDHLLITRIMEIYVLETKAYGDTLEIRNDGSFVASYRSGAKYGVPSPVEQNKRHIHLLRKIIADKNMSPKRLGMSIPVKFKNIVLIDPHTRFIHAKNTKPGEIIKADQFISFVDNEIDKMGTFDAIKKLKTAVSRKTVQRFSTLLASLHTKSDVNYRERFGIIESDLTSEKRDSVCNAISKTYRSANNSVTDKNSYYCFKCKATISYDVAKFCFDQKKRFKGRAYCRSCQGNY